MNKIIYIGITGNPGVGKDTFANSLKDHIKGASIYHIVKNIRRVAAILHPQWTEEELESHPTKDEKRDGKTGRELTIETAKIIDDYYGKAKWMNILEDQIIREEERIVIISDVRTIVQLKWLQNRDAYIVNIKGGESKYDIEKESNTPSALKYYNAVIEKYPTIETVITIADVIKNKYSL